MSSREDPPSAWGWAAGSWGWGDDDDSTDDVIEQLSEEFAPLVSTDTVIAIVGQCRRELEATPPPSPEDIERLARQQLRDMTGRYVIRSAANTGAGAGSSAYVIIQLLPDQGQSD
jgi:hypothetical protein